MAVHQQPERPPAQLDYMHGIGHPEGRPYRDDEIVHIDPTMGQPLGWMLPGARALWMSKSGKSRKVVTVEGRTTPTRVKLKGDDGVSFYADIDRVHEWLDSKERRPVPGSMGGVPEIQTRDMYVDPAHVARVVVKIRGKKRYDGPVSSETGELLNLHAAAGRKMVVTLHMRDGTKRRYRGNGKRLK